MGDIGKYFNRSEFACKCGCGFDDINPHMVVVLDKIREAIGHGLKINSGCRCADYNLKVGGKPKSAHVRGFAADINIANSKDRYIAITTALSCGVTRFGIADGFIHIDTDKSLSKEVIWTYK